MNEPKQKNNAKATCRTRALLGGTGAVVLGITVAVTVMLGIAAYGRYIEPETLTVSTVKLPFPDSQQKLEEMASRLKPPAATPSGALPEIAPAAGESGKQPAQEQHPSPPAPATP
jgi:hypothetical protein